MIDPVIGWFEITYCNDNKSSMIAIKVETMWLDRYPYPIDVTYDQGVELLGCEFKNTLIEEGYGIKAKPVSPGNPQTHTTIERMFQVLGNIV